MLSLTDHLAAINAAVFGEAIDPVIKSIVNPIIMLMFAVALVVFAYGVLRMVWGSNEGESRKAAKMSMLGGVIGMFIMMSAWGIVYLISNTIKSI